MVTVMVMAMVMAATMAMAVQAAIPTTITLSAKGATDGSTAGRRESIAGSAEKKCPPAMKARQRHDEAEKQAAQGSSTKGCSTPYWKSWREKSMSKCWKRSDWISCRNSQSSAKKPDEKKPGFVKPDEKPDAKDAKKAVSEKRADEQPDENMRRRQILRRRLMKVR